MPQHEQLDEEVDDSWIDEYNAAMMRKPQGAPQLPEVGCYPGEHSFAARGGVCATPA